MIQTLHLAAIDLFIGSQYLFLSQANFDTMMSRGGGIILKIIFLMGVISIASGGLYMNTDRDKAKWAIVGGIIAAAAVAIMEAFFSAGGLGGSVIRIGN